MCAEASEDLRLHNILVLGVALRHFYVWKRGPFNEKDSETTTVHAHVFVHTGV